VLPVITAQLDPPQGPSIPATNLPAFTPIPQTAATPNVDQRLALDSGFTHDPLLSMLQAGGLAFEGPLSDDQQINLYRASLAYSQTTVADSLRAAKEINQVGYGDPSNICGPLAIAILRDAGLLNSDAIPHDFWLLDPRTTEDQRKLARAFPRPQFTHDVAQTPLNKMDWRTSPLQPGDFLFIWHGSGGNFDHMLVVNRVDRALRAFAVTNFATTEGFMIAETLLYDPNDPTAGIFHTWTREQEAILGSTGFGGFELWRARGQ
jgi:hypothetical protein